MNTRWIYASFIISLVLGMFFSPFTSTTAIAGGLPQIAWGSNHQTLSISGLTGEQITLTFGIGGMDEVSKTFAIENGVVSVDFIKDLGETSGKRVVSFHSPQELSDTGSWSYIPETTYWYQLNADITVWHSGNNEVMISLWNTWPTKLLFGIPGQPQKEILVSDDSTLDVSNAVSFIVLKDGWVKLYDYTAPFWTDDPNSDWIIRNPSLETVTITVSGNLSHLDINISGGSVIMDYWQRDRSDPNSEWEGYTKTIAAGTYIIDRDPNLWANLWFSATNESNQIAVVYDYAIGWEYDHDCGGTGWGLAYFFPSEEIVDITASTSGSDTLKIIRGSTSEPYTVSWLTISGPGLPGEVIIEKVAPKALFNEITFTSKICGTSGNCFDLKPGEYQISLWHGGLPEYADDQGPEYSALINRTTVVSPVIPPYDGPITITITGSATEGLTFTADHPVTDEIGGLLGIGGTPSDTPFKLAFDSNNQAKIPANKNMVSLFFNPGGKIVVKTDFKKIGDAGWYEIPLITVNCTISLPIIVR